MVSGSPTTIAQGDSAESAPGFHKKPFKIVLRCLSPLNNCSQTYYRLDSDPSQKTNYGLNWYAYTIPLPVSKDGNWGITYYSKDANGNTELQGQSFFALDTNGPSAPILSGLGAYQHSVRVDLSWSAPAGSSGAGYNVCSSPTGQKGSFSCKMAGIGRSFSDTAMLGDGKYYYFIEALDGAGNDANSNISSITIDTAPPSMSNLGADTIDGGIELAYSGTDSGSGIESYEVSSDGRQWTQTSATSYRFTGLGNGTYTFYARAQDKAGNVSEELILTKAVGGSARPVAVDNPAPGLKGGVQGLEGLFESEPAIAIAGAFLLVALGAGAYLLFIRKK